MSGTTSIDPQKLSPSDKKAIKKLIRYGDVGRIAIRTNLGYQRVSDIINKELEHDEVWIAALAYFRSQPREALDRAISNQTRTEVA